MARLIGRLVAGAGVDGTVSVDRAVVVKPAQAGTALGIGRQFVALARDKVGEV
jgi:hypothetical protein